MKYFYQQLVGFLSVVLVSVVVCGLLFYNVMTNKIFLQRSQQLFGYAKAILVNDLTAEQINSSLSLLKDVDQVAYVRFASVYRQFNNVESFLQELHDLLDNHGKDTTHE